MIYNINNNILFGDRDDNDSIFREIDDEDIANELWSVVDKTKNFYTINDSITKLDEASKYLASTVFKSNEQELSEALLRKSDIDNLIPISFECIETRQKKYRVTIQFIPFHNRDELYKQIDSSEICEMVCIGIAVMQFYSFKNIKNSFCSKPLREILTPIFISKKDVFYTSKDSVVFVSYRGPKIYQKEIDASEYEAFETILFQVITAIYGFAYAYQYYGNIGFGYPDKKKKHSINVSEIKKLFDGTLQTRKPLIINDDFIIVESN